MSDLSEAMGVVGADDLYAAIERRLTRGQAVRTSAMLAQMVVRP